jgi:1-acyl-sn-glycerol-3-phosphate acyltransferase
VPSASLPLTPEPGPSVPRTGGALTRAFGRLAMRVLGWRLEGGMPDLPKFVIIVAPHTSNWDFPVGVAAKMALRLQVTFLGKNSLFRFPLGIIMRALGGMPVDRSASNALVSGIVAEFARRDQLVLVVAPEGTRKKVDRWKTGFYHIARGANLPIVPVALDWGKRAVRIGEPFTTTGNIDADIATLQSFYSGIRGRN